MDSLPRAQARRSPSCNGRFPTTLGELHPRYPRSSQIRLRLGSNRLQRSLRTCTGYGYTVMTRAQSPSMAFRLKPRGAFTQGPLKSPRLTELPATFIESAAVWSSNVFPAKNFEKFYSKSV
jgi:hypothetical protein